MAAFDYGQFDDGTPYTIGECDDPKYKRRGLYWICIGDSHDHTTFIVEEGDTSYVEMKYRGSDKRMWEQIAVRIIQGFADYL